MLSFAIACRKFFGFKEGQKVGAFVAELKDLTKEDREEMAPLLAIELGEEVGS